ncbi:TOBE domain-containing protein [Acuticoccus sp.]|uniref:TOBE domain-containing protein n=1 Tax=Acuticoccus sp. TaxID=1904378 RepID=UPI003B51A33A
MRPERTEFVDPANAPLFGTVVERVFLGDEWLFKIATPLGELVITRRNAGHDEPHAGAAVHLAWANEHLRVLARNGVPFMVLTVWAALQRQDPATQRTAQSLGARSATVFRRAVLPQAMPGVLPGSLIVFSLSASAFATPQGRRVKVVAMTVYDEILNMLNWPLGAAIAVTLLVAVLVMMIAWNSLVERGFAGVIQ